MNDGQKYYTPAPEDIRIGFEYLLYNPSAYNERVTIIIEDVDSIENALKRLKKELDGDVMVPYLTAEQIAAEGWTKRDDNEFTIPINAMCEYVLSFEPQFSDNIRIRKEVMDQRVYLFFGKCRCKNDLRLICKMIGI